VPPCSFRHEGCGSPRCDDLLLQTSVAPFHACSSSHGKIFASVAFDGGGYHGCVRRRRYDASITVEPIVGVPHSSTARGPLRRLVATLLAALCVTVGAPALVVADDVSCSFVVAPDQASRRAAPRRRRRLPAPPPTRPLLTSINTALEGFAGWVWRWSDGVPRLRRGPPPAVGSISAPGASRCSIPFPLASPQG
jgi:hypothetical protein